ncbi:MAG: hypothetical protein ACRDVP_10130, partial [Acidimicrobiales bacterium]
MRAIVAVVGAVVLGAVLLAGCVQAVVGDGGVPGALGSTRQRGPAVPQSWELLDRGAAATCPG